MTLDPSTVDSPVRVVSLEWSLFLRWMESNWPPGTHLACVGPTGEGKTTFVVPLLHLRKWVMALDAKGLDPTLSASGFERITKLPLSGRLRNAIAEGKAVRLILGGETDSNAAEAKLRALLAQGVAMVRHQGGWTLYADEFQVLADLRMFGLGKSIEQGLISARAKGTSIVTSFQAPAWVPKASTRQATIVVLWPTRDLAMVKSIAESMGRDWRELLTIVQRLPRFHVLVIPKSIFEPYIITHAPELS